MAVCLLFHILPLDETNSPQRKQGGRRKWIFRPHSITIEPRTAREAAWMLQTNIKIRNLTMKSIAEDPYLKFKSSQMLCQLSRYVVHQCIWRSWCYSFVTGTHEDSAWSGVAWATQNYRRTKRRFLSYRAPSKSNFVLPLTKTMYGKIYNWVKILRSITQLSIH